MAREPSPGPDFLAAGLAPLVEQFRRLAEAEEEEMFREEEATPSAGDAAASAAAKTLQRAA